MEKIKLPGQGYRQRGGSGLSVAVQPQVAENGVKLIEVPRMEVDGKCRGAGERVSAQMAVRLQLAGGRVQFESAQIDGAVALGIGSVDQSAGSNFIPPQRRSGRPLGIAGDPGFICGNLFRRSQVQVGIDGDRVVIADRKSTRL